MKFNFEKAVSGGSGIYITSGKLTSDVGDVDLFNEVRDSYADVVNNDGFDFGNHLTVGDDYIQFDSIDLTVLSNMLKILRSNLGITISADFSDDCIFNPSSLEPLVKMEVRKKFK